MKILIDNGHGEETPGKQSPDLRLREYAYTREIAERLVIELQKYGIDSERIVLEEEDIPLCERCRRVNEICQRAGKENVLLLSIHCNASSSDGEWHEANGWSAYIGNEASAESKAFARDLITAARESGLKVRVYSHQEPYWSQNLAICRDTSCPCVLTENLFLDNQKDVDYLLSEEGKHVIVNLHVQGIRRYLRSVEDSRQSTVGALRFVQSPLINSLFVIIDQVRDLIRTVRNIIRSVKGWFRK